MKLLRKLLASLCLILMLIFAACNDAGKSTSNTSQTKNQALVVSPEEDKLETLPAPAQQNQATTNLTPPTIVGNEKLTEAKIEVKTEEGLAADESPTGTERTKHRLVHIGLQGKEIPMESLPAANIVFLIDVSGSMEDENKLPQHAVYHRKRCKTATRIQSRQSAGLSTDWL